MPHGGMAWLPDQALDMLLVAHTDPTITSWVLWVAYFRGSDADQKAFEHQHRSDCCFRSRNGRSTAAAMTSRLD